ncbi:aspartate aminotransferase family protein [Brevibacterium album]|uniref:aspartate aminotransferase family protein n=1 Tax=Brevibacterium album TaxID=417948 RepID=UPI00040DD362|nr:aminotransferase class III-fold pyridoxal phosphate-dependent enzyme [Brevibacterium album]
MTPQRRAGTYRTFYSEPLEIDRAEGCTIIGADGRRYLDAYNNVPVLGHSNPEVAEAVHAQLLRANTHTRYLDPLIAEYTEELLALLPQHIEALVFACSGSEAVDLALQLARFTSMSEGVVVTRNAYHGTTAAVAEVSPSLSGAVPDRVALVDVPEPHRTDFDAELGRRVAEACRALTARGHGVAALLVDSTFTSDGILAGEGVRLTAAVDAVHAAGGLYIADEVQSGFRRTGSWWGYEHLGVAPDLITLGKPMGNGLPISAVAGPRVVFDDFGARRRYFNTFAGTPVPVAAAQAVLRALSRPGWAERVEEAGARLGHGLWEVCAEAGVHPDVRRSGLMLGLDLRPAHGGDADAAGAHAGRLVEDLYRRGVLVSSTGPAGAVLKIRPPLVIADAEIDVLTATMRDALAEAPR